METKVRIVDLVQKRKTLIMIEVSIALLSPFQTFLLFFKYRNVLYFDN